MKKQFSVLVVDDEPRILKVLETRLKLSGYNVFTAVSGTEALALLQIGEVDLIVLDILMPGMDGFETLKQVRGFSNLPVIILSAKKTNADKIKGLKLGADDYLTKPFNPDELVARIEAVIRRMQPAEGRKILDNIVFGKVTINFQNHQVIIDGKDAQLTHIEWALLSELAHNSGKLMLYEELLTKIWGSEYRNDVQILRIWISRLRHKIEPDPGQPPLIHTVSKSGYMINEPLA